MSTSAPPSPAPADARAAVRRLLAVVSGQAPFSEAGELLADNVALLMDGRQLAAGPAAWRRWVVFLRATGNKKMRDLQVCIDDLQERPDGAAASEVAATARWRATQNGQTVFSAPLQAVYLVQNGKITRISTHRRNYVFVHGERIAASRIAFYWLLLRVWFSRQ